MATGHKLTVDQLPAWQASLDSLAKEVEMARDEHFAAWLERMEEENRRADARVAQIASSTRHATWALVILTFVLAAIASYGMYRDAVARQTPQPASQGAPPAP